MAEAALRHFWGMSSSNHFREDSTPVVTRGDTQRNSNGPPQSMVIVNNQDDVDHDVYMLHRIESVELELQDNQQVEIVSSHEDGGYMTDDLLDDVELAERRFQFFAKGLQGPGQGLLDSLWRRKSRWTPHTRERGGGKWH